MEETIGLGPLLLLAGRANRPLADEIADELAEAQKGREAPSPGPSNPVTPAPADDYGEGLRRRLFERNGRWPTDAEFRTIRAAMRNNRGRR